jgi:hypothetical protein
MLTGHPLTTELQINVLPTEVDTARFTSKGPASKLQTLTKECETKECVTLESNKTVATQERNQCPLGSLHTLEQGQKSSDPLASLGWIVQRSVLSTLVQCILVSHTCNKRLGLASKLHNGVSSTSDN